MIPGFAVAQAQMGAQRCSSEHSTTSSHSSSFVVSGFMGSTGRGWKCPWCGRRDSLTRKLTGYALDGVGYPICISDDYSCVGKLERGLTKNGVRAGALFQIIKRDSDFELLMRVQPSLCLDIADFLYGMRDEPRSRPLLYRWNRLSCWTTYYCEEATLIRYEQMVWQMQESRHIPTADLVQLHL